MIQIRMHSRVGQKIPTFKECQQALGHAMEDLGIGSTDSDAWDQSRDTAMSDAAHALGGTYQIIDELGGDTILIFDFVNVR